MTRGRFKSRCVAMVPAMLEVAERRAGQRTLVSDIASIPHALSAGDTPTTTTTTTNASKQLVLNADEHTYPQVTEIFSVLDKVISIIW